MDALCADLRWLGVDWEEGPSGGAERLVRHRHAAAWLVEHGYAEEGPGGAVACTALGRARGEDGATLAGQVLLRGDGTPTDLLAHVVDAHDAAVTHVLCSGERPAQVDDYRALCAALGWAPPAFVQLPPLAGDHLEPSAPVSGFRERGYTGLAVANWLARLGWSPRGRRELRTLPELAQQFDPSRLARRPVRADLAQLDWFNRRHLARMDRAQLGAMLAIRWQRAYGCADRAAGTSMSPAAWRSALAALVLDRACALFDAVAAARFAFEDQVTLSQGAAEALAQPYAPRVLSAFADGIAAVDPFAFDQIDAFVSALRWEYKERLGIRSRDVMHTLRAALTGRTDGACLIAACEVLGRERCAARARQALDGRRA
ncbi:MAG: hypothetical protein JXA09_02705 [Anaerolineae bacterium]|nr:hypothetical protein [Anaerolineae bacterium]